MITSVFIIHPVQFVSGMKQSMNSPEFEFEEVDYLLVCTEVKSGEKIEIPYSNVKQLKR